MNLKLAIRKPEWNKQIKIGDLKQVDKELKLGSLSGNRFSIAIRFVQTGSDTLTHNMENI